MEHKVSLLNTDDDDDGSTFRLTVRRKHLFEDTIKGMKRLNDPHKHFRVIFMGEPSVDEGGPRREFFHLFFAELHNKGTMFAGPMEKRILVHNAIALHQGAYFAIGKMIALSLIHGGSGPQFFAPCIANYLLGCDEEEWSVNDIADPSFSALANKVSYLSHFHCHTDKMESVH